MSEHNIPTRPGLKGVITSKGNTKTDETGAIIKYKTNLSVNVHNNNYVNNTNVQFINLDLHFNYLRIFKEKYNFAQLIHALLKSSAFAILNEHSLNLHCGRNNLFILSPFFSVNKFFFFSVKYQN